MPDETRFWQRSNGIGSKECVLWTSTIFDSIKVSLFHCSSVFLSELFSGAMSVSNPVARRRRVGAEHPASIGLDNLENTDAGHVPERVRDQRYRDESILKNMA
jgi:hypothetical protein